ncbi:unnamed protein product [Malus baccata var. baccata]
MACIAKEVETELLPFLRVYKDGYVERLLGSQYVPPLLDDPETGVSSKDITISQDPLIKARVFLPKLDEPHQKLPVLVYYHGGGFCVESAFSSNHHRYLDGLVSQAKVVAVSVEYRMAPEHCLPAAYEDGWAALQWIASHFAENVIDDEPWLTNHGNSERLFLGGDRGLAWWFKGVSLTHPYFCGSKENGSETCEDPEDFGCLVWNFVYPSAPGGVDCPMINPVAPDAPSLVGLACSRLFVSVSENDELRHGGISYYEAVTESGWEGEAELVEVEGEDHAFHILKFETPKAKDLTRKVADFLTK